MDVTFPEYQDAYDFDGDKPQPCEDSGADLPSDSSTS